MQLNPASTPAATQSAQGSRAGAKPASAATGGFSAMLDAAVDAVSNVGTTADKDTTGVWPAASSGTSANAAKSGDATPPAQAGAQGSNGASARPAPTANEMDDDANGRVATSETDAGSTPPTTDAASTDVELALEGDGDNTAALEDDKDLQASTDALTDAEQMQQAQQAIDTMLSLLPPGRLQSATVNAANAATPDNETRGKAEPAVAALTNLADNPATTGVPARNGARAGKPAAERSLPDTAADAATEVAQRNALRQAAQEQATQEPAAHGKADRAAAHSGIGLANGLANRPSFESTVAGTLPEAFSATTEAGSDEAGKLVAARSPASDLIAPPSVSATGQTSSTAATLPTVQVPATFGSNGWPQSFGQQVVWSARQQLQSASLTLNPPELGPVRIELQLTDTQASAQFSSHQPEVRQAIEQALPQLKELFANAGLQLQQASVDSGQARQQDRQATWTGPTSRGGSETAPSATDDAAGNAARALPAVSRRLLDTYA